MSDSDSEPLEFSAKDLMPDWVQEIGKPGQQKPQHGGGGGGGRKFDDRGGDDRRGGGGRGRNSGGRGGYGGGGDRRGGGGGRDFRGGGGGDRRGGGNDRRGGGGRDFRGRGGDRRDFQQREPREEMAQNVEVFVRPTQEAIQALAKHIKSTARAFPLIDVAKMVLGARERFEVVFERPKPESGKGGVKPFYICKVDGSIWQTVEEATAHMLNSDALDAFYITEEVSVDPPKGAFTVVAVCGMSGTILGPPNHHEYQSKIARLHAEQFSNMQIDRFKSRIQMSNDEETIEKWKQEVSVRKQYRVKPPEVEKPKEPEPEPEAKTEVSPETPAEEKPDTTQEAESDAPSEEATVAEATADSAAETEPPVEVVEEAAESPADESIAEETDSDTTSSDTDGEENSDSDTADSEAAPEETTAATVEPEPEAEPEGEILTSVEALERHFRDNFSRAAIASKMKVTVQGNIPAQLISRPLLNVMKSEVEKLRRGFPLPMIQELCRRFEKTGLKFFKRGKKSLHVSIARPRAIGENLNLSERVMSIVNHIEANPRCKAIDLIAAVIPGYIPPAKGETFAEHTLTEEERNVLKDLRWLTLEGYVIEFTGSELVLGKQPQQQQPQQKKSAKKPAKKKAPAKKGASNASAKPKPEVKPGDETAESPTEKDSASPEPVAEITEPAAETIEHIVETAETAAESTEPATEPAEPVAEPAEPVAESTEPVAEATEPVAEATEPVTETAEPAADPAEPVAEATGAEPDDSPSKS